MKTPSTEQIKKIFDGGLTTRYHTEPSCLHQAVDAHSWGVVTLVLLTNSNPTVPLLRACALHDVGERWGPGDVRYQSKRDNPTLRAAAQECEDKALDNLGVTPPEYDLTDEEFAWLKWADMAEVAMRMIQLYEDFGYPSALRVLGEAVPVTVERARSLPSKAAKDLSMMCAVKLAKFKG
jgi:hypothetical protein